MNNFKPLTPFASAFIQENYAKLTYREMKKELNVGTGKMQKWLQELGLKKVYAHRKRTYPYTPSDLEYILLLVSKCTGVTVDDLKGEPIKRHITLARSLYCYLAWKYTRNSTKNIGKHIGDREHTTVYFSVKSIEDLIYTKYDKLMPALNSCQQALAPIYPPVNRLRHKDYGQKQKVK